MTTTPTTIAATVKTPAHTPGPWTYCRNPGNTRWIIDSEPAHAIACTAGHEPDNEANARLIAAAPALLEALREAIEELWDRDHSSTDRIQFERDNASLFAALSQAGGASE